MKSMKQPYKENILIHNKARNGEIGMSSLLPPFIEFESKTVLKGFVSANGSLLYA